MRRSATRRDDARSIARGALPPGKSAHGTTPGEGSPTTEGVQRPEKPSRRLRPLSSSTNNRVSETHVESGRISRNDAMGLPSAPSQWKMGRSPTPGPPDENDDWILDQQALPLPLFTGGTRARSRTISSGKRKSEEKKSRSSFHQEDSIVQTGEDNLATLTHTREPDAEQCNARTRSHSVSQEKTTSLRRRISWGRNKKHTQELHQEEFNYKRASQLGLPELEKDLVPSLRDTVHKMTHNHRTPNDSTSQPDVHSSTKFFASLSPPTTYGRSKSSLSSRPATPVPMESTPMKTRHQVRSPRMEVHSGESDTFYLEPDVRLKSSKIRIAENGSGNLSKSTRDYHDVSETKPKSALKSLRTPRPSKSLQGLSPSMDTDDSSSEPVMRTPRVRSSSKSRASPLLPASASPARTLSNIPSPKLRSRSSSFATRSDKSPSLLQSEHKSPRLLSASRSPFLSADQTEATSRSEYLSGKLKAVTGPRPSKSPVLDRGENAEGTPKPSRIASNTTQYCVSGTNGSSDEKLRFPARQSSRQCRSPSTSARLSRKSDYDKRHPERRLSVLHQDQSAMVITEQSASEFSEHEIMQCDKASEDSHARRKKELVDLVAGLNPDLGLRNDKHSSAQRYRSTSFTGPADKRKDLSHDPSGCPTRQGANGIAAGGSTGTAGFKNSSKPLNEAECSHKHANNDAMPRNQQDCPSSRRSSALRRHSSTPRPDAADMTINADQANSLLKAESRATNRDSLLMLNADRQREAFGIPPSVSNVREASEILSSEESSTSLRNPTLDSEWEREVSDGLGLSHGAEKLFHTLGIGAGAQHGEDQPAKGHHASWRSSMAEAEKYLAEPTCSARPTMSASSSSSSIYEDDVPDRPWQKRERDLDRVQNVGGSSLKSSWKKTLSNSAYASLLERHGEAEMRRQEVIWELCETEQVFLKSLRTALKVFVNPLLGKNRAWVSGLPSNVSRFLDWLEDIYQLHTQISSSLQHARSSQYPIVLRIAEAFRPFVPRLEVYQPYIVRLDEVGDDIEEMMKDSRNELGEFFRIQSSNDECAGISFSSFLWLPLTRLGRYLKYFNALWILTPRSHVDHLPSFSLLHSATMVVRVMREVKLREEEHTFVKELISRVQGLPNPMQLMQRERRLIAHGALQRVHFSERTRDILEGNSFITCTTRRGGSRWNEATPERQRQSTAQRRRANSLDYCLSEGASMNSLSSAASNSSLNDEFAYHHHLRVTSGLNGNEVVTHGVRFGRKGRTTGNIREGTRTTELYAFIFTDLAIFATPDPRHARDEKNQDALELLDDVGICRILSVADHSGNLGYDHLVGLHILPMDVEQLDKGILSDTSATSLFVHLPNARSSGSQHSGARQRWLDAFDRCHLFTLRSLSFPTYSGRYLVHGPAADQDENTQQTVMAILASGLPLPKSPSEQIGELEKNAAEDVTLREREERGWWAVRFQQTLHEMQRDDVLQPPLQRTPGLPSSRQKTVSGRRRLKLGSGRK